MDPAVRLLASAKETMARDHQVEDPEIQPYRLFNGPGVGLVREAEPHDFLARADALSARIA